MAREGAASRVVRARPEALYEMVSDVPRIAEWSPECRACAWTGDGPGPEGPRPGDRFRGTSRWRLTRWHRVCEVVTADPGREFAFRTIPGRLADDSTLWRYRFEPTADGTRVTESYEVVRGLPAVSERLALTLLPHHRDLRPHLEATLEQLAAAAERGPGPDVDQLELPGQAAAPRGPVDVAAMYVMHHGFRRDLRTFAAAAEATPVDDTRRWAAMARRWGRFADVLHKHHRAEDAGLWPLLVRRARAAGDVDALVTLRAMEDEHAGIDGLLDSCADGLRRMADGATADAATRTALIAAFRAAGTQLGAHLAHEERDAMALVQRLLTQADWERIDRDHFSAEYRPADIPFTLGWVIHRLPEEAHGGIPGGPGVRAFARLLGPWFRRGERRAFGDLA